MRDELAKTKDYPGITGVTSFDENGEALKRLTKATVSNGAFVPVK